MRDILCRNMLFFCFLTLIVSLSSQEHPRTDEEIYREMDGEYVNVGDMILEKDSSTRMAQTSHPNWPDGIVPYIISENVTEDLKPVISKAVKYINKYTCLKIREKKTNDKYWLRFLMKENANEHAVCSSYVGWLNKEDQGVFLGPRCFVGSMIHELLHAVGFFHEHTRTDRDKYITVNKTNFADEMVARNYALDNSSCTSYMSCEYTDYGVKYNYESIMHYCERCGSKDHNYPVFIAKKGTDGIGDTSKIGQREGFSEGDWHMVNNKYSCDTATIPRPKPLPAAPIVQTPEDEENTFPPFPTLFPTPTTPNTPALPTTTTTTPAIPTTTKPGSSQTTTVKRPSASSEPTTTSPPKKCKNRFI